MVGRILEHIELVISEYNKQVCKSVPQAPVISAATGFDNRDGSRKNVCVHLTGRLR